MLTLMVDFNARRGDEVRGLREEVVEGEDLKVGDGVLLDDGEGNTAWGQVSRIERNLIFARVNWSTWGGPQRIVQGSTWVELPHVMLRYTATNQAGNPNVRDIQVSGPAVEVADEEAG